jgi:pimeloyl-ACP methyl ester carboxylesterase
MQNRRVSVATGVVLDLLAAGAGGRPLLLVHGFTGAKEDFADHLDDFGAAGWHAVAPDLRGHGRSEKPDDPAAYDLRTIAGDVLHLAGTLGWERFSVFGHEAGGVVAQELALAVPDRLDALVLQSTAAGPFPLDRELALGGAALVTGAGSMEPLVRVYREEGSAPLDADRAEHEMIFKRMLDCAPAAYAAILRQLLDAPDRSLRLAELAVPTFVAVGEHGEAFVDAAADLASVIPGAVLWIAPGCGLRLHAQAPGEWLGAVEGFLQATRV